jgi:osmotically-inducible protein OsmY
VYDPYVYDYYPYDFDWYAPQHTYTYRSDADIRGEVKDELFWSPFVDANQVRVSVDGGVVRLQGVVDSYSEMHTAVANAYEGGAVWVDNDLSVK